MKIDYKQQLKYLYKPSSRKVELVDVPAMNYLMIDGEGDPNTSSFFQEAIDSLYPVSYTIKFNIKKSPSGLDYTVMPLEGLWWAEDMSSFSIADKKSWKWTLMIMQPEPVTQLIVEEAIDQVRKKKNPMALPMLRYASLIEGKSAQTMHIGPFSEEGPCIEKVHSFIHDAGSQLRGKHHEIYLSDIRKAAPSKWKTVIRQPMT